MVSGDRNTTLIAKQSTKPHIRSNKRSNTQRHGANGLTVVGLE